MFMLFQLIVAAFVSFILWKFIRLRHQATDIHNIPGPPSKSWLTGNLLEAHDLNGWEFHAKLAEKYGGVVRITALFGEKQLYVFDPKALHSIIIKDQYSYPKTSHTIDGNRLAFGEGLFGVTGEKHRKQRKMLNPVFSIAHMRDMTPIFYSVVSKLQATLDGVVKDGPREVDIYSYMGRTALELIGQSGLGYSFDNLEADTSEHPYATTIKGLIPALSNVVFFFMYILPIVQHIGPPGFRRMLVDKTPSRRLHKLRDMIDLMHATSVSIYKEKKKALADGDEAIEMQVAKGKDIMSLLMRENVKASEDDRMEEDDVIAQMSTFIFAGMDTTSGAVTRILDVLAHNLDAQEHLRREIRDSQDENGKDIPYDILVNLPYLDAVCRETLRLYPPVSLVDRKSSHTMVVPLSKPIIGVDGREMHEVVVPPNTNISLSILCCNRNPEIWGQNAHEWKPERWIEGLPPRVAEAKVPGVYSNLMTFLGGGRSCIGFKFSQLEMKVTLVYLISSFKFEPSEHETFWGMTGISSPSVKGVAGPQLPLIMSKAV